MMNTSKAIVLIIAYLVFIIILIKVHEAYPGSGFVGLILALILLAHIIGISTAVLKWFNIKGNRY